MYRIIAHSNVSSDMLKIPARDIDRVREAINTRLIKMPALYGIRLRGNLKGYWKLRIGDYRIVYTVGQTEVKVLAIAHRKDIYKIVERRIES